VQIVIAHQYITLPGQRRQNCVVRLEARAENERSLFARERGEFAFEPDMQVKKDAT